MLIYGQLNDNYEGVEYLPNQPQEKEEQEMIELIGAAGAAIAIGSGLYRSVAKIPAKQFAVVDWFGYRLAGYLEEGVHPVPPFSDTTEFSLELATNPVKVSAFTWLEKPKQGAKPKGAKLEIELDGSVQWRPDPGVQYRMQSGRRELCKPRETGRVLFIEMKEETILSGIADAIKSQLGTVAGLRSADEFIRAKEEIELMINAILRLGPEELPHITHDARHCGLYGCGAACEFRGPIRDPLKVYRARRDRIRDVLRDEKHTDSRSEIEERYGIDIELFALAPVNFSEKAEEAFEKRITAQAEAEAAEARAAKTLDLLDRFKGKGLDPEPAVNAAQVAIGQATRQIHSIEGIKPLVDIKIGRS